MSISCYEFILELASQYRDNFPHFICAYIMLRAQMHIQYIYICIIRKVNVA